MPSRRAVPALAVAALLLTPTVRVRAAEAAACAAPEHRQFDFWIGDWDVAEGGKPAGHNRIESILGGCALRETWTGVSGLQGTSLNVYFSRDRLWHQTWVDSSGLRLDLAGGLQQGSMVLSGNAPGPKDGAPALHRITWTPEHDGSVRQHWQASKDGGSSWSDVFLGTYRRSAASAP